MKFKIIKNEVFYILQNAVNFISIKNTNTILQNIYISAENGKVVFKTNSILSGFCAEVDLDVEMEGTTTVICKKLFDIVKEFSDSAIIEFFFDGSRLKISSGQANFSLATMSPELFPAMSDITPEYSLKIDSSQLADALDKTLFCVATNATKIEFTGLHLKVYGNKLELHSSDFQRISSAVITLPEEQSDEFIINIPKKTASDILKVLDRTATVEIYTDLKQFMLVAGNIKIYSRLIEKAVKSINTLFSSETPIEVVVDKNSLSDNIRKVLPISTEITHAIVLSLSSDQITVYTLETEYGQGFDKLNPIKFTGDPIDVILNGKLLLEILSHIDCNNVILKLSGRRNPVFIYPEYGNYKYLIVPLAMDRG
ncbi:DNA polymerase III subunit beta [Calditerrivibrio nitroreducens]|uniref:Beta sliding clamp n=1 Tax=Calditerrivibrio nitroreducens (strain DSM 19672 / NBRC 101217 / Yu37-1) TaxID=768670 RepID=E4TI23_CALNY|nr:DNA polymerase III subunit beta [Calditerrivibrio nitroreducens]ADR17920.1 DNA polymerase III, beta subunit [Calditerrivibrio nitroreducens DSM 19672]